MEHKVMFAEIDAEAKLYPIASDEGWQMWAGHGIKVDKFEFVAAPVHKATEFVVAEQESGCMVMQLDVPEGTGTTTEAVMMFLNTELVPRLASFVIHHGHENVAAEIVRMKEKAFAELGQKPQVEKLDLAEMLKRFEEDKGEKE